MMTLKIVILSERCEIKNIYTYTFLIRYLQLAVCFLPALGLGSLPVALARFCVPRSNLYLSVPPPQVEPCPRCRFLWKLLWGRPLLSRSKFRKEFLLISKDWYLQANKRKTDILCLTTTFRRVHSLSSVETWVY